MHLFPTKMSLHCLVKCRTCFMVKVIWFPCKKWIAVKTASCDGMLHDIEIMLNVSVDKLVPNISQAPVVECWCKLLVFNLADFVCCSLPLSNHNCQNLLDTRDNHLNIVVLGDLLASQLVSEIQVCTPALPQDWYWLRSLVSCPSQLSHLSSRQHLSGGICLDVRREDYQNCSALC